VTAVTTLKKNWQDREQRARRIQVVLRTPASTSATGSLSASIATRNGHALGGTSLLASRKIARRTSRDEKDDVVIHQLEDAREVARDRRVHPVSTSVRIACSSEFMR